MEGTQTGFEKIIANCRSVFVLKLGDYGPSWRVMRPNTVNDQLLIKAQRIREIETTKVNMVGDSIESELVAIINYAIIGIIQLKLGFADSIDKTNDEVKALYDEVAQESEKLMLMKNHDYGEAWRSMDCESFTDIILTKIFRNKSIMAHNNATAVSEGCDANFFDIINYAVFYLINSSGSK